MFYVLHEVDVSSVKKKDKSVGNREQMRGSRRKEGGREREEGVSGGERQGTRKTMLL